MFLRVLSVEPDRPQVQFDPISISTPDGKNNIFLFWSVYRFHNQHGDFSGLVRL